MFFLANASSRVNTFGQVIGCALLLDHKIIATQVSLLNPHMTENIHIAYDFAYARFSPGLLLDRAFARGSPSTSISAPTTANARSETPTAMSSPAITTGRHGPAFTSTPALQKRATRSAIAQMVVFAQAMRDPSRQMVDLSPATRILA
jgi:hypothetical protein